MKAAKNIRFTILSLLLLLFSYGVSTYVLTELLVNQMALKLELEMKFAKQGEFIFSYDIRPRQLNAIPHHREVDQSGEWMQIELPLSTEFPARSFYFFYQGEQQADLKQMILKWPLAEIEIPTEILERAAVPVDHAEIHWSEAGGERLMHMKFFGRMATVMLRKEAMDYFYDQMKYRLVPYSIGMALLLFSILLLLLFKTESGRQLMRLQNYLFVSGLLVLIFYPFFSVKENQSKENRSLEPFPDLNVNIWKIPNRYKKYYDDHFPFRNELSALNNWMKVEIFGVSPKPDHVRIGKDGWLFYSTRQIREIYQGHRLYAAGELESKASQLQAYHKMLKAKGKSFYFMIAPLKHTVYPEYLPPSLQPYQQYSKREQLLEYLRKNTDINIIDPVPLLKSNKDSIQLYYRNDTHWNEFGAFMVYRHLIRRLRADYPQIPEAKKTSDYLIQTSISYDGDLVKLMNYRGVFERKVFHFKPKFANQSGVQKFAVAMGGEDNYIYFDEHPKEDLPSMLMYRDSFTEALYPFLSEHFSYSAYAWDFQLNPERINQADPDIVIMEVMERFIDFIGEEN